MCLHPLWVCSVQTVTLDLVEMLEYNVIILFRHHLICVGPSIQTNQAVKLEQKKSSGPIYLVFH